MLQSKRKEILIMTYTWKVVYFLPSHQWSGGNIRGVAFVEACTQHEASWAFKQQYAGQFSTIEKIEKFG
jgi:hypothetical protein